MGDESGLRVLDKGPAADLTLVLACLCMHVADLPKWRSEHNTAVVSLPAQQGWLTISAGEAADNDINPTR